MDFGKITDLTLVNFTMPPDHPDTSRILSTKSTGEELQLHVGCPVWANKSWIGNLYPEGIKDKDFLKFYSRKFNTIELNTTHYRIPDPATIFRWRQMAAPGFLFCPKFPQQISHEKLLENDAKELTRLFITQVEGLQEHLGMSFLQLPLGFSPDQLDLLKIFLQEIPEDFELAIEFRHPDWFKDTRKADEGFKFLEERNIATVITDVAGRRDVLHQRLTHPVAFIRFIGNGLHHSDYTRQQDWSIRLREWQKQGLQQVYFFTHQPGNELDPVLGAHAIELFNTTLGTHVPPVTFRNAGIQGTLF